MNGATPASDWATWLTVGWPPGLASWGEPPLPPASMAVALSVVLLAGIVRGFSGFGFAALAVAGLSLTVSPARVVPAVLVLELMASARLLPGALRDVDARWLRALLLGNALAIPGGVALLAFLPEAPLRLVIAGALVVGALALRSGWHPRWQPTPAVRLAVGLVSGIFNGLAAVGGIAIAVLLAATPLAPHALRATLIVLFLFTDLYSLCWAALVDWSGTARQPLLDVHMLRWVLWLAPAMLLGISIGARVLARMASEALRRRMIDVVLLVALVAGASALARW